MIKETLCKKENDTAFNTYDVITAMNHNINSEVECSKPIEFKSKTWISDTSSMEIYAINNTPEKIIIHVRARKEENTDE